MKTQNQKLAKNIVNYSLKIKSGEKVLIEASVFARDLVMALVKEIYNVQAYPFVHLQDAQITRSILNGTSKVFKCKIYVASN